MALERRAVTTILGLVVVGLLVSLYGFDPFLKALARRAERVRAKEVRILRNEQLIAHAQDYRKAYEAFEPALVAKRSGDEESSTFLKAIESQAKATNLLLEEMRPLPVVAQEGSETYAVYLSTEGSLEAIAFFLHGLASSPDLVEFRRLQIAQRAAAQGGLKAEMEISRRLFR